MAFLKEGAEERHKCPQLDTVLSPLFYSVSHRIIVVSTAILVCASNQSTSVTSRDDSNMFIDPGGLMI